MTALYLVKTGAFDASKVEQLSKHIKDDYREFAHFMFQIRLVTWGEPRTGNVAFAKEIEQLIQFRYRVVKKNDAVSERKLT